MVAFFALVGCALLALGAFGFVMVRGSLHEIIALIFALGGAVFVAAAGAIHHLALVRREIRALRDSINDR